MTNIRAALNFTEPYWTINREEANYAAILYYALLSGDNLRRFLDYIECDLPLRADEHGAYFEYAYLRDLWDAAGASNDKKRAVITDLLGTKDVRELRDASVKEWNVHFGVSTPVPSAKVVQSPSSWSMKKFNSHITDHGDFLATCKFKWSFNIKPDLVIHTTNDHAAVIEAKYASGEGRYPAEGDEKAIFTARGLDSVGQTELQEYMFRHLLGIEAIYLYVVKKPKAKASLPNHKVLLWKDIFAALDVSQVPSFVHAWLRKLAHES